MGVDEQSTSHLYSLQRFGDVYGACDRHHMMQRQSLRVIAKMWLVHIIAAVVVAFAGGIVIWLIG